MEALEIIYCIILFSLLISIRTGLKKIRKTLTPSIKNQVTVKGEFLYLNQYRPDMQYKTIIELKNKKFEVISYSVDIDGKTIAYVKEIK